MVIFTRVVEICSLVFSPKKSPGIAGVIGMVIFVFMYWFLFTLMSGRL